MALKKRPKVEDLLIGTFVLLAFMYPFIITSFIQIEEGRLKLDWRDKLRVASFLIGGLEECTADRAVRVAKFFERRVLQEMGGVEGLIKMCLENKEKLGDKLSVEESVKKLGEVYLLEMEISGERGSLGLKVYGKMEDGEFRITGIENYAERG